MPRIGGSYNSVDRDRFPLAEPLGDTLVAVYDRAYWLGPMIFFCISALILYTVLHQARLVPVWLSIRGLVGGVLLLVRAVSEMYGVEFSAALQAAFHIAGHELRYVDSIRANYGGKGRR
jgi:phosphotransferase system  glucose/maltose/N-acetylglucosamine-specific IIC component